MSEILALFGQIHNVSYLYWMEGCKNDLFVSLSVLIQDN